MGGIYKKKHCYLGNLLKIRIIKQNQMKNQIKICIIIHGTYK